MTGVVDPFEKGLAAGWRIRGGEYGVLPQSFECDVVIVGSGAGGGVTAEVLARAGLRVLMVEEGPLRTSRHFRQRESDAYAQIYQESAARKTADKAINILQGRCVGGSTTVNWTSSFRTPPQTLGHWQAQHGLAEWSEAQMQPWFEQVERRLNITPWEVAPNENNDILRRGATRLGMEAPAIRRNVRQCWNLGSCGMGCPTNAKQSMLVTTVPHALSLGATLWVESVAKRLEIQGQTVKGLWVEPRHGDGSPGPLCLVKARHYVLCGGAINTPALLLRSHVKDPFGLLGRRTFLHPVVISAAVFDHTVAGWHGAPQTIYTDHFLHTHALTGPIGYKIEAPPLHPIIFSTTMPGFGEAQSQMLKRFPQTQALLALLRDGFHPESPGGVVKLNKDGSPLLDYPLNDFVMEGARRALLNMAEIQFAAGAKQVLPVHEDALLYSSWAEAKAAISALEMRPLRTRVVSAHVMGGCAMAGDERKGVVRADGTHWQLENLSVHDGSVFPTSIGANPQLSVYALAARMSSALSQRLTGKPSSLAVVDEGGVAA
jgi:choline dehydrogenase-like flavoprotein